MDNVTTVGIDLAKNVFSLHGIHANGGVVLRRTVSRARLMEVVAQQPACLIGLEACSGAHEWARRFQELGHTVKLMVPRFVVPYRKNGKNDGNDAEAICEAVSRPSMRFVPIKTLEQQAVLCLHRVRQGFVEERTATINRLRGLLAEFGFVLPQKAAEVRRRAVESLELLPAHAACAIRDLRTVVDRKTGYVVIGKLRARTKEHTNHRTVRLMRRHPQRFKTITADNGTEFHDYAAIEQATDTAFYFATPHHSWERGTNENTNGLIRQYVPKGTSMAKLTQQRCNAIARALNNRPRKRLGFKTPQECFNEI